MATRLSKLLQSVALGGLVISISACGPQLKEWEPYKNDQVTFGYSRQQLPPEPVYRMARWVEPPEVLPSKQAPASSMQMLNPIIEVDVKRVPLRELGKIISSLNGYSVYTASNIAERRVSVRKLGTIDEIVEDVSVSLGIKAVVDHQNRSITFINALRVSPEFYSSESEQSEVN